MLLFSVTMSITMSMSIILSISFTIFASVSLYLHTCLYRLPVSTEQSKREERERESDWVLPTGEVG